MRQTSPKIINPHEVYQQRLARLEHQRDLARQDWKSMSYIAILGWIFFILAILINIFALA